MSENLNVLKTGRYEARVKDRLATVLSEADRQREEWNLSNEAQRSLRVAAGLNRSEPICSVIIRTSSNGVKERVEPVLKWRRQYHASAKPAWMHERSGVTGLACGEGYSREDVRSHIPPMRGIAYSVVIESSNVSTYPICNSPEVNPPISGSETVDNGEREVRQVHSRDEFPVMGIDPKGPDFCKRFSNSSGPSELPERKREGIAHEE